MKKKVLALCLVLALTLAMTVPAFAAPHLLRYPDDCSKCRVNNWIALDYVNYRYIPSGNEGHWYAADMEFVCSFG